METFEHKTENESETWELAHQIASKLKPGDVLTLEGDLGAGKTTFTKGIAKGLGINQVVNSPTFTIIKEYQGDIPLYHMDVYRLDDESEELGLEEYFEGDGVSVIEWPTRITEQLPEERLDIQVAYRSEHERSFILMPRGDRYIELCKELEKK
ncbi:tRNA (adenosine(37)-N6)-threonylcarbamoyltransferase complex ATPase subunit type 1 TsaE [Texcoconibacillus texcoconensis]|uniref:tRNA threonylcarbamoyladenosine biosynthesis protein TsaE n=1 Tax=Texcoconibacillus texcoconensis TaxID=1095777 RepID=A0A840QMM9_9BACI|nr:tRNA (adenosine(37)-N6)-threonylcarbamoyltransferase complex ATPase subunit type 1 TsaE [Texcoconibacillus texcoconensis]MBB5172629.1 tRNA threonylcarbamoyladenosine biosynthesis protein TsaE [Texcoconibacillus texcoconensis]